jgi:radical SAM superfamily enzyme YgiQ (UPF0313 family)
MDKKILALCDMGSVRGISVRYLSSFIKSKACRVKLIFPLLPSRGFDSLPRLSDIQKQNVYNFLLEHEISHLGFQLMTGSFKAFKDLVKYLRSKHWQGTIIAGGVHAFICPEETLCDGVDYVVVGPGEESLLAILKGDVSLNEISGLWYRHEGVVINNPISNDAYIPLNELPFPDYDFSDHYLIKDEINVFTLKLFNKHNTWGGKQYYLTTSRGCPYRCTYCCNVNHKHISRASIDHIMLELKQAKEIFPDLVGINIEDDCFFLGSDEWTRDFSVRLKNEINLPFIIRIIPRFASKERLELLRDHGLKYVSLGLQGSERLNRDIYLRKETNKSVIDSCNIMAKLGITYIIDIILDNVYETEDDLREIASTLNQLKRPFKLNLFSMTVFPGTKFYEKVVNDNLLDKFSTDPYESVNLPSKKDGYKTPLYWKRLYDVISINSGREIDKLIKSNPLDEHSVKLVDKLFNRFSFKMKCAQYLKQNHAYLFDLILDLLSFLRKLRS